MICSSHVIIHSLEFLSSLVKANVDTHLVVMNVLAAGVPVLIEGDVIVVRGELVVVVMIEVGGWKARSVLLDLLS